MTLRAKFKKRAFKQAIGAVMLLSGAQQAHANQYQDLEPIEAVEASVNPLQELAQSIAGGYAERGPIPKDSFHFDPEKDYITLDAGFGDYEYIQKVEQSANEYVKQGVDPHLVVTALKVSREVGVDFMYLMKTIEIECTFDFKRSPKTSSAKGPGLLNGAWTDLARKHGDEWGFDVNTDRTDHYWGSLGAALYIKDSISFIRSYYKEGELEPEMIRGSYFFGDGGNRVMLSALQSRPSARARDVFPRAARANPTIFRNRSIQSVYRIVGQKVEDLQNFFENPPSFNFHIGKPRLRLPMIVSLDSSQINLNTSEYIAQQLPVIQNAVPMVATYERPVDRVRVTGKIEF